MRARHVGRDIAGALKNIVGGETEGIYPTAGPGA
ncbi:MAG: hypothetical protein ACOCYD_01295 [bacterium]